MAVLCLLFLLAGPVAGDEIRVIVWDDPLTEAVELLLPEFEQATGHRVQMERVPIEQLLAQSARGVSPQRSAYDLIAIDEPYVAAFSNLVMDYADWPAGGTYAKIPLADLVPEAFAAGGWQGRSIGLPASGNVYVWMTRRDLIEDPEHQARFEAAYGYPLGVPQTFDQLLDMGTYFSKQGYWGFAPFTARAEGATCEAAYFFAAYGTSVMERDEEGYRVSLEREKAVEAIRMYRRLLELVPARERGIGTAERNAAFDLGEVFTMFQWPSIIPRHESPMTSRAAGRIVYSEPPAGPAGRAAVRGTWILAIPKAAPNPAAAAELAYWWQSAASGRRLVDLGMTPVRNDLLEDPELVARRPWFEATDRAMRHAVVRPRFESYSDVTAIVQRHWVAGVTGEEEPEQAVDRMIRELEQVIERYEYYWSLGKTPRVFERPYEP